MSAPCPGFAQPGDDPRPVAVAEVIERDIVRGRPSVGTVVPNRISQVGSAVEQRVIDYPVRLGDRVKRGSVLAKLRTTRLEIEKAVAEAELRSRLETLKQLENGARPGEIAEVEARVTRDRSAFEVAQSAYLRLRKIAQSDTLSIQELDDARSAAVQAEATYAESRARLELIREGPRLEEIDRARALVDVQRETIRQIEDEIAEHTIVAPFAGYVVRELTEVGQWLRRGDPVATLVDLDRVDVEVPVLEDYESALRIGLEVPVQIGALDDRLFVGTISAIVPEADARSRSFPVRITLENPNSDDGPLIKSGMFARATLPGEGVQRAILVPKDALVIQGGRTSVYIPMTTSSDSLQIGSTMTVQAVAVRPGIAWEDRIQVTGSLEPGQYVITEGNERLRAGDAIRIATITTGSVSPR